MDQKHKIIALLVVVGILAGAGIGYVWFSSRNISQEVAYQIQWKVSPESQAPEVSTGSVIVTGDSIAYISAVEGNAKLKRKDNESLVTKDTTIQNGDIISSDTGSSVEIIFADNSFLRLEENSKLTVSSANQVELENGGLWARILKPLQDTSIFTINASDLSAGVRGTAVYTHKSDEETKMEVIDTTETRSAVDITVKTESGIIQDGLENEESITITKEKHEKIKLNMDQLLQEETMRNHLKSDILLMNQLMNEANSSSGSAPMKRNNINSNQMQKIRKEIFVSLPKNNELNKFFISPAIEGEARQLNMFSRSLSGSRQGLTEDEQVQLLIEFTANDMELWQLKKDLQKKRDTIGNFTDETQKQEYQNEVNTLEIKIRDFDENWTKKERTRIEKAQLDAAALQEQTNKFEGDETITESGSITGRENSNDGSSGSILLLPRVPNVGKKPNLPTVPDTSTLPGVPNLPRVPPKSVVSGPARPKSTIVPITPPIVKKIVSGSALPRR